MRHRRRRRSRQRRFVSRRDGGGATVGRARAGRGGGRRDSDPREPGGPAPGPKRAGRPVPGHRRDGGRAPLAASDRRTHRSVHGPLVPRRGFAFLPRRRRARPRRTPDGLHPIAWTVRGFGRSRSRRDLRRVPLFAGREPGALRLPGRSVLGPRPAVVGATTPLPELHDVDGRGMMPASDRSRTPRRGHCRRLAAERGGQSTPPGPHVPEAVRRAARGGKRGSP